MGAVKKSAGKVKRLREDASRLVRELKFVPALELYDQLISLEPEEAEWSRRAADCCWYLKESEKRLRYSILAAKTYARGGLLLKAIAMCKVALSIDPTNREIQEELSRLHARRPNAVRTAQPKGVRRIEDHTAAARAVRLAHEAAAPREPGPGTKNNRAARMRARMAAAATLRRARAQEGVMVAAPPPPSRRKVDRSESSSDDGARPGPGGAVLGKIALKPRAATPIDVRDLVDAPPTPPRSPLPSIPSLRLPAPSSRPHPPLLDLRLSERVQCESRASLGPDPGSIYSLTLGDVPSAELRPARVPNLDVAVPFRAPLVAVDDSESEPSESDSVPSSDRQSDSLSELMAQRYFDRYTLEHTPLFNRLSPDLLEYLIDIIAVVELEEHQILFEEGDVADAMYVVVEGSVVATTAPRDGELLELARLVEGEFFGEIGLLSDQPRQATVSACETTRLLRFDRSTVGFMVDQAPEFLSVLLQFLKERLVEDLMLTSPLFAPFGDEERQSLVELFEFLEVDANSVLMDYGQHPIGMYVLLTGGALVARSGGGPGALRRLSPGDIFGEQALLRNQVSNMQVRTTSKCFAICLPSDAFMEVIMTHPTVLEYLSNLSEGSTPTLHVDPEFLDHVSLF